MAISLDVRRMFRNSSIAKGVEKTGTIHFPDGENLKARHILGLDSTCMNPTDRDSSLPSSKPRGVTFSDATTAVVSSRSTTDDSEGAYGTKLKRRGSSILGKKNRTVELQENVLRSHNSNSSLGSFYDKTQIPLSVSQQTSDSSSRDFALRIGAPSIMSKSSQEKEHVKQLRIMSSSQRTIADRRKQILNDATPSRASSLRSHASSIFESNSMRQGSQVSEPSTARISITRALISVEPKSPLSKRNSYIEEYPPHMVITPPDPTQAKINVRRPKVGAKNWFDSIDTDSSEDDKDSPEPRLEADFDTQVQYAFEHGQIAQHPTRTSSAIINAEQRGTKTKQDYKANPEIDTMHLLTPAQACNVPDRATRRRCNPFEVADLSQRSVLWLSSSDESDYDSEIEAMRTPKMKIRRSLANTQSDDSEITAGRATKYGNRSPEVVVKDVRTHGINSQVPKRKGSKLRLETYLEDESTTTLTQHDLLTSFPSTPLLDNFSGVPSLRESMLSETESIQSTKLMTVTRQEEKLIAAMRIKKVAMKRAQQNADRDSALRDLEQNAESAIDTDGSTVPELPRLPLRNPRRQSLVMSNSTLDRNASRQDSVTTIQTGSATGQSVRSSIATYLSEGSDDLQLPYSSIYGLPMGSSTIQPPPDPSRARPVRDTFLSEMTIDSAVAPSSETRSVHDRNSHIVLLDPIEHHLLRDEIPSQLFLESPYVGWSIQSAH